ncbi:putative phage protein [Rickettsiales endosymbiont of Paramecium tredecaurelia]|nr:putative phage protein [Candidatus Sarmatiella mevalonica]
MGLGILARIAKVFTTFNSHFLSSLFQHTSSPSRAISYLLRAGSEKNSEDAMSAKEEVKFLSSSNKIKNGHVIPLIFGKGKVEGRILWCGDVETKCVTHITRKRRGGYIAKVFNLKKNEKNLEYQYSVSFAMAICRGKVERIDKVYWNNKILNIAQYKYAFYHGDSFQNPDQTIQSAQGEGKTPAFRGLSYIVFTSLPLQDFDNQIPNLTFEVSMACDSQNNLENKITAVNMIPGSGEFVYDTVEQKKWCNGQYYTINAHNKECKANAITSLEQLGKTCKNVKYIAPVVCWFGDNLDIKYCSISPRIESKDTKDTIYPYWHVGEARRATTRLISRDDNNKPNYGGTVHDASVIRYLKHLKSCGYKIMFYPMIFLDLDGKPWRGHLGGAACDVPQFFNKKDGYNNFILHYANLTKDYVDAFLIGSELKKLTAIRDAQGAYPAVEQLLLLAAKVRSIVGRKVLISYAADWSEYHHDEHGHHHLDSLFADDNINFVGIDAYFPITDSQESIVSRQEILDGMNGLEGCEYYYSDGQRHNLKPEHAWKNLRYWWENYHYDPSGAKTKWKPRMKKIWFTEFGFPSIDKAPNQPNVFYNPDCVDGNIPKYSNGQVDFGIQRKSIEVFIDYWSKEEYIEEMFLWTWDARPYPLWPHTDIWSDSNLWEKGHWINGKLGMNTLAEVLHCLSKRAGIKHTQVNTQQLEQELIDGLTINQQMSALDIISLLRARYFFDPVFKGQIMFSKRGVGNELAIDQRDLIVEGECALEVNKIAHNKIMSTLYLYFIDKEHKEQYLVVHNQHNGLIARLNISPLLTALSEARDVGEMILSNALMESATVSFIIPIHYMNLAVGDFVKLSCFDLADRTSEQWQHVKMHHIRVVHIEIQNSQYRVFGVLDNLKAYFIPRGFCAQRFMVERQIEDRLLLLDLPFIYQGQSGLACFVQGKADTLYACDAEQEERLQSITQKAIIGSVIEITDECENYRFVDEKSCFKVYAPFLEDFVDLDGWKLAKIGDEIVQFLYYEKYTKDCYKIYNLCRGMYATDDVVGNHRVTEDFIPLDLGQIIALSEEAIGREIVIKTNTGAVQRCVFEDRASAPLKPILKYTHMRKRGDVGVGSRDGEYGTLLEWIVRFAPENKLRTKLMYDEPAQEYEVCESLSARVTLQLSSELKCRKRSDEDFDLRYKVIICIEDNEGVIEYEACTEDTYYFIVHAQDVRLYCMVLTCTSQDLLLHTATTNQSDR